LEISDEKGNPSNRLIPSTIGYPEARICRPYLSLIEGPRKIERLVSALKKRKIVGADLPRQDYLYSGNVFGTLLQRRRREDHHLARNKNNLFSQLPDVRRGPDFATRQ